MRGESLEKNFMEAEESACLAAIQMNPEAETTRLVFADWLEDRSDPRAPWVRDAEIGSFMAPDASDPIPGLLAQLRQEDHARSSAFIDLLVRLGAAAVPALILTFHDENANVR